MSENRRISRSEYFDMIWDTAMWQAYLDDGLRKMELCANGSHGSTAH